MSNHMTHAASGSLITIAALAALLAAGVASAANDEATAVAPMSAQPAGELLELGEIWVRGKNLSDVIADAEDELFRLYNKVNRRNQFDIHCSYARLDRDSLAMSRTCLPQFVYADAVAPGYFHLTGGSCPGIPTMVNSVQNSYVPACDVIMAATRVINQAPNQTTAHFAAARNGQMDEQRQEYSRNFIRVLYRDPALIEKAGKLAALYEEMAAIQDSYALAKSEEAARTASSDQRHPVSSGPRGGPDF